MKRDSYFWDVRLSWASAMFFIGSAGNAAIKLTLSLSDSFASLLSIITGLIILSSYALCFRVMLRRSSNIFWKSVIVFFFIYIISAILILIHGDPLSQMISGTAFLTFAWWIPTGVMACSVRDKSILYSVWVKASFIISFFALAMFVYHRPSVDSTGGYEYNIFFGNCIILPLLIQISFFFKKKNFLLFALILLETVALFLFANRGVILSLVFFLLYKFAFESKNIARRVFALMLLAVFVVILTSSIQTIAENAVKLLDTFGLQSRTLDLLAGGLINETSGRDDIWRVCYKMIGERPVFGWGLGGEYYEIAHNCYGVSDSEVTAVAYHPHNGIIQNLVCFGVPLGILVTCFLLYPLIRLNKSRDKYIHELLLIFASAAVIPICISSANFFTTPSVAIYLYLFYRGRKIKKRLLYLFYRGRQIKKRLTIDLSQSKHA